MAPFCKRIYCYAYIHTEDILVVGEKVAYAMAAVIALSFLFLAANFGFLVKYRKHKVNKKKEFLLLSTRLPLSRVQASAG